MANTVETMKNNRTSGPEEVPADRLKCGTTKLTEINKYFTEAAIKMSLRGLH